MPNTLHPSPRRAGRRNYVPLRRTLAAFSLSGLTFAAAGCASSPGAPKPAAEVAPPAESSRRTESWYRERLFSLAESYQPPPADLPNRWSEVVRTAFLYSGAATLFAAHAPAAQAFAANSAARMRPDDFMLAVANGASDPALLTESARFLDELESRGLLLHLHQIAAPCRLLAPPPYPGALLTMQETYEQGPIRHLASACSVRMRLACHPQNCAPAAPHTTEQVLQSFRSGMNLGRALCGRPMLVSLTNAHAVQNSMMLTGLDLARRGLLDDPAILQLLAATESARLPHPETFLEMERIIGLESLDAYFAQHAREQAAAPPDATVSITDLSRDEAVLAHNQSFDRSIEILKQELGEHPRSPTPPPVSGVTYDTLEIPNGRTDPRGVLRSLASPLSSLIVSELEHRCIRAAMVTGLRLEIYRRATGSYPQALTELNPPPPEDPLAAGRLLGYQPPTPGSTTGYKLYSVGSDRIDNGGAPPPNRPRRDALFVPVRWRDTDFPIVGTAVR
jgi:hypothetical protein